MAAAATHARAFPKPVKAWPSTVTLTFGDCAENHRGMQIIGEKAAAGLDEKDMLAAKEAFEAKGLRCELIDLREFAPPELKDSDDEPVAFEAAWFLIVRNGVSAFTDADALYAEQVALEWDKKALMYGEVRNKHARHNLCYGEEAQEPNYAEGLGRIVPYSALPHTSAVRRGLPAFLGKKAEELKCEGNMYHTPEKCGIGYHGDAERRIAIGVRLGKSMPMVFRWFYKAKPIGKEMRAILRHGDCYAMCQKAVGTDFKRKNTPTLRHAAGCKRFTQLE